MKHYKEWTRRLKVLFITRILLILIAAAGVIGIGVAIATDSLAIDATFIVLLVILAILFLLCIFDVYKLVIKINKHYAKVEELQKANSNPEFVEDSRLLRTKVEDLDIQTLSTIQAIARKEEISKVLAAQVLVKTEAVVSDLVAFVLKYPGLSPTGIKDPKILKELYGKRVEALNQIIDK